MTAQMTFLVDAGSNAGIQIFQRIMVSLNKLGRPHVLNDPLQSIITDILQKDDDNMATVTATVERNTQSITHRQRELPIGP